MEDQAIHHGFLRNGGPFLQNGVNKVNDEKNLEADMVRFEKGLKARPAWIVIPGGSSR
jgi:hypothetical protein